MMWLIALHHMQLQVLITRVHHLYLKLLNNNSQELVKLLCRLHFVCLGGGTQLQLCMSRQQGHERTRCDVMENVIFHRLGGLNWVYMVCRLI